MNSLLNLIRERHSIRSYSNRPVERKKIEQCIEAARLAPSACNSQPWKFIVVDDLKLKNEIAKSATAPVLPINQHAFEAPVIVAVVIDQPKLATPAQVVAWLKNRDFPLIDIGIATEHFCLQATELGLGTCIMGWFNEKQVKKLLKIPTSKKVGLLISLGYAPKAYQAKKKPRKEFEEICEYNGY